ASARPRPEPRNAGLTYILFISQAPVGSGRRPTQPATASFAVASTRAPAGGAYEPGSEASSRSKSWKQRSTPRNAWYSRNSSRTTSMSWAGTIAGTPTAGSVVIGGDELQCQAVVAVALAGGRGTVVEHVALVAAAAGAMVLGARQDQLEVAPGFDRALDGLEEARPAGAAVELGARLEQGSAAAGTDERALAVLVVEFARKRRLGSFPAQHAPGVLAEPRLPLGLARGQRRLVVHGACLLPVHGPTMMYRPLSGGNRKLCESGRRMASQGALKRTLRRYLAERVVAADPRPHFHIARRYR